MGSKSFRANYPDLDAMKLLMALLVVEIHTRPLRCISEAEFVIEGFESLAVPFFFVASAFLCFRGLHKEDFTAADSKASVRVRKTTGKLMRLYLTWTALFLPITVFGDFLFGRGPLISVAYFVRGTLFVGENFCSWPLWYLLASVVAFALVYFCLRGGGISKADSAHLGRIPSCGVSSGDGSILGWSAQCNLASR